MSAGPQAEYIAALTELHRGLARQGPGDAEFSRELLRSLPPLPPRPRIADLGCGAGAGALLLALHYQSQVKAVDSSAVFIEELKINARRAGLDHLVVPIHGDMAALDWPPGSIDLLWSEGAAYNLGFERALRLWKPLVANHGIAVVSEMSWFTDRPPEPAQAFWQVSYPTMATESENVRRAGAAGFHVLSTRRLPSVAWWKNYYDPLRERMQSIERTAVIDAVLRETAEEMALFERYCDSYGYSFYVMQAR